jgi:isoleucyl-tRNA synthetase
MFEANFVTLEQGTGIVHCAPSHGPDDFNLCLKHGIKAVETVNNDGRYTKNIPVFEGTHVFKADEIIIKNLQEQKNLLGSGTLVHSYPHSWRSKAPLVHRATPQWFISMESHKLRKKALDAIDQTAFYPEKGKARIRAMIETRPDWCISRQRSWGVPLPIFVNKKTNEALRDSEVVENIAKIYEKEGSDCWFYDDPQRFLGKKYKKEDYIKSNDIVEVWFDSGSTHSFVLEKRKDLKWPASMYLEGSDQHRGWFHSSLLESCGTRGRAPFDSILSHGFVVDGKGMKMSKSSGNIISPEDILKKYGADILRLWVASSDYAEDLRIDHSILEQHAESYRKIRNTFRFILGNLRDDFSPKNFKETKYQEFPELEKLILHKLYILNAEIKNNLKDYNFHKLQKDLLNFCALDLSSFYFDIRKDVLYCDETSSQKRKSCVALLNIILECLLKWYAPVLSFTTEEITELAKKNKKASIHEEIFPEVPGNWKNDTLYKKWEKLLSIRQQVNIAIEEKRSSKVIGSSLEADVEISLSKQDFDILKGIDAEELFITSHVKQNILKGIKNELTVAVKKANGTKCSRCWKISKKKCERNHCPIK